MTPCARRRLPATKTCWKSFEHHRSDVITRLRSSLLVHAELVADVLALHHQELRVELLLQLAQPLKGEVGRAALTSGFPVGRAFLTVGN
jgi:hypothetical protein